MKRALVAAGGAMFRLPRVIPRRVAIELGMTGDPIDAERAYHLGLVNVLCEPGQALDEALALADRINANAPLAVRATRRVMLGTTDAPDEEGWKQSYGAMAEMAGTQDFAEGPKAFIEKREPVWQGR